VPEPQQQRISAVNFRGKHARGRRCCCAAQPPWNAGSAKAACSPLGFRPVRFTSAGFVGVGPDRKIPTNRVTHTFETMSVDGNLTALGFVGPARN